MHAEVEAEVDLTSSSRNRLSRLPRGRSSGISGTFEDKIQEKTLE